MKITRSNYESWFLDFLEGNLESSLMGEFQTFLKENPDLALELEIDDKLTLRANEDIRFDSKDELKKSVSDQTADFQERAVAYHEGDLSLSEQREFEASLAENSALATEVEQFGKLKLVADKATVYRYKEQLKKRVTIIPLWMKAASVAAILLLAYLILQPGAGMQPEFRQLADDQKNKGTKNVAVPDKKRNAVKINIEKTAPVVTPKQSQVNNPVKQKNAVKKDDKKISPATPIRAQEPMPLLLKPRGIYFGQPEEVELAVMTLKNVREVSREVELSELLKVQLAAIRNSNDRELLSTEHLGLSGLQLFAKLSGKRLTARKGDDGVVESVSFNTRLLAISIPVNR